MTTLEAVELVVWDHKYDTGIELIDSQHRVLIDLINALYRACRSGDEVGVAFKDAMHQMVKYVNFHLTTEQDMLRRVKYPQYREHCAEHEELVKTILDAAKDFGEGKRFVPHNFVRALKDWLLTHIGVSDRHYSVYIHDLRKKGLHLDL